MYLVALQRTIAEKAASLIVLRKCPQEVREELGYTGDFAKKKKKM